MRLDSIDNEWKRLFNEFGSTEQQTYEPLIPIKGTSQYYEQEDKNGETSKKQIGHVAYSEDFGAFVYQTYRHEGLILQKVKGKGVSIDASVIETLKNNHDVEYVFVGKKETHDVFVFDIEDFDKEVPDSISFGYEQQRYVSLDEDMKRELPGVMNTLLSDPPYSSDRAMLAAAAQT